MISKRELELERLRQHEERMSRPVKELFQKPSHQIKYNLKCKGPGCNRPPRFASLCDGHYDQMKTKGVLTPLRPYVRTHLAIEMLLGAADAYGKATTEEARATARKELLHLVRKVGIQISKRKRLEKIMAPSQLCPPGAGSGLETPSEGDTEGVG